jgi:RND family efflux transporter MFP subunit
MAKKTEVVNQSENTEIFVRTNADRKKHKPSKKKILISFGIIIAIIAGIAIFIAMRGETVKPVLVSTGSVEKMDIEETVSIRGTIEGSESANVSSALNSMITAVNVKEGDRVKKDQVLATLDVKDIQDEQNRAALALRESKRAYDAAEILYNEGAISRDEYLGRKAAYERDRLNSSSINIADKRDIKSPIDGIVTRVNINAGRYASDTERGQAMFIVENLDDLQMKVSISEYDISKIKVGQTAIVTADVLGKDSVKGVVSSISPTGEQKDPASTEKVIPIVISIDKEDKNLIAGVTARATILIEKQENATVVSIDAIAQDPETGEDMVFVVEDGILRKVPVVIGLETNTYIEILGNVLKEGDQIVLAPGLDMEDGMAVIVDPVI